LVAVAKFIVPDWGIKSTMVMEEDGAAIHRYEKSSTGMKQPGFNKYIHTKYT